MSPAIAILGFALLMLIGVLITTYAENKERDAKIRVLEQELRQEKDDAEWLKIYYSLGLERRIYDLELQTGLVKYSAGIVKDPNELPRSK